MTVWRCGRCRAQVAPGAPRCPECPSTEFIKAEAEAGDVLKISRDGTVSDSADVKPFFEQLADVRESLAEANAEPPADGPPEPAAVPEPETVPEPEPSPVAPPRVPPRRIPPTAPGD